MKYKVIRVEFAKEIVLMQCGFEDKKRFKQIAQSPQYRILKDGKDVTEKYMDIGSEVKK